MLCSLCPTVNTDTQTHAPLPARACSRSALIKRSARKEKKLDHTGMRFNGGEFQTTKGGKFVRQLNRVTVLVCLPGSPGCGQGWLNLKGPCVPRGFVICLKAGSEEEKIFVRTCLRTVCGTVSCEQAVQACDSVCRPADPLRESTALKSRLTSIMV